MPIEHEFEQIETKNLLARVQDLRLQGARLVQVGATRLADQIELTYSFDLAGRLTNLRLNIPATEPRVSSISAIYWCAFLYENEIHDLFGIDVDGMAVDFHGKLYHTSLKYPFGSSKIPTSRVPQPALSKQPKAAAPS